MAISTKSRVRLVHLNVHVKKLRSHAISTDCIVRLKEYIVHVQVVLRVMTIYTKGRVRLVPIVIIVISFFYLDSNYSTFWFCFLIYIDSG